MLVYQFVSYDVKFSLLTNVILFIYLYFYRGYNTKQYDLYN